MEGLTVILILHLYTDKQDVWELNLVLGTAASLYCRTQPPNLPSPMNRSTSQSVIGVNAVSASSVGKLNGWTNSSKHESAAQVLMETELAYSCVLAWLVVMRITLPGKGVILAQFIVKSILEKDKGTHNYCSRQFQKPCAHTLSNIWRRVKKFHPCTISNYLSDLTKLLRENANRPMP